MKQIIACLSSRIPKTLSMMNMIQKSMKISEFRWENISGVDENISDRISLCKTRCMQDRHRPHLCKGRSEIPHRWACLMDGMDLSSCSIPRDIRYAGEETLNRRIDKETQRDMIDTERLRRFVLLMQWSMMMKMLFVFVFVFVFVLMVGKS
eukprot:TRINITY_DN65_c0_g4_i1.p1 TRINITY_DN65_c0_g4~~TRINITY_DN65_c0_g4_i1.p1  ORF type:complete len:151 (+),score=26.80 TRINITY_DN65_c0_g4_i1:394-846(+)